MNDKSACFDLKLFALITKLNCSAYLRESKLNKFLRKWENIHFKVTHNKIITDAKFMRLIKSNKLNKEQKLSSSVWFVLSILLFHDRSKIVILNHIKMKDDLDFFNNYPWEKESFENNASQPGHTCASSTVKLFLFFPCFTSLSQSNNFNIQA